MRLRLRKRVRRKVKPGHACHAAVLRFRAGSGAASVSGVSAGAFGVVAQPLGSHLREGPTVAVEDRVAAGLGLPAFDGDIDIGRADLHREDAAAVGLARHDLRAGARERLVAEPAARDVLAHRDAEGVERFRRRMVGALVLGEGLGSAHVDGSVSSATFGGRFGRRQPMKQGSCFQR